MIIEASQRMISEQNNPIINEHFELQIKTLQNAPRDPGKLERLLKAKERGTEEGNVHGGHTERLVTEQIEMLKRLYFVFSDEKR